MATQTVTATDVFELQAIPKTAIPDPQRPSQEAPIFGQRLSDAESSTAPSLKRVSTLHTFLTIFTPSFVGFIASFTNGIITVGLPIIARSISLERSLYLWPSSVYGLTSGAALLIAGSIADIVGARSVEMTGITFLGIFTLACGFAQSGAQLVVFRALQGVALALHLPASVAIITGAVPSGRARNLGFACLGFSQPLGFAVGLVLSGVMIERAGWRVGFYLTGGCLLAVAVGAIWTLPKLPSQNQDGVIALWKKVGREIDWVGGMISSGGLAILAYVLAFQEVQHASTLATSLYLLPNLTTGVLIQIFVGLFIHRIPARWLVAGSACICALSPLLMAVVPPAWSYWKLSFWAQIFAPFSADVLFTVGLIIVSDNFPEKTQALAGAVFNTVAQFGMSLGMGSCQVVALGVQTKSGSTASTGHGDGESGAAFEDQDDVALLKGYRASYWLMFGYMIVCMMIAVVGLKKAGKVGLKRE
ncbi:MFS general substrate transporter [Alternaria alternata]|nr:MFS general substrate transporter [Alternaria alternata]